ncbi:hypothetical protein ACSSS7_006861 [Eimeria intestinalis]
MGPSLEEEAAGGGGRLAAGLAGPGETEGAAETEGWAEGKCVRSASLSPWTLPPRPTGAGERSVGLKGPVGALFFLLPLPRPCADQHPKPSHDERPEGLNFRIASLGALSSEVPLSAFFSLSDSRRPRRGLRLSESQVGLHGDCGATPVAGVRGSGLLLRPDAAAWLFARARCQCAGGAFTAVCWLLSLRPPSLSSLHPPLVGQNGDQRGEEGGSAGGGEA